jgi:hypothetical protein
VSAILKSSPGIAEASLRSTKPLLSASAWLNETAPAPLRLPEAPTLPAEPALDVPAPAVPPPETPPLDDVPVLDVPVPEVLELPDVPALPDVPTLPDAPPLPLLPSIVVPDAPDGEALLPERVVEPDADPEPME